MLDGGIRERELLMMPQVSGLCVFDFLNKVFLVNKYIFDISPIFLIMFPAYHLFSLFFFYSLPFLVQL